MYKLAENPNQNHNIYTFFLHPFLQPSAIAGIEMSLKDSIVSRPQTTGRGDILFTILRNSVTLRMIPGLQADSISRIFSPQNRTILMVKSPNVNLLVRDSTG